MQPCIISSRYRKEKETTKIIYMMYINRILILFQKIMNITNLWNEVSLVMTNGECWPGAPWSHLIKNQIDIELCNILEYNTK